jgi:hypothetical protein
MKCNCHRYASANSFSNNFFKIIVRLDWERKNDFTAGNNCSMAGKNYNHLHIIFIIFLLTQYTTPFPAGGVSCLG